VIDAPVAPAPAAARLELAPRHRRELLDYCRRAARQIERLFLLEAHLAAARAGDEAKAEEARKLLRLATGVRRGLDKWR
jgi:hypothetical protein